MLDAVQQLHDGGQALIYSETGQFWFGPQRVTLPVLLPPISAQTAEQMRRLAARRAPRDPSVTFGFFGGAYERKGVLLLIDALRAGLPEHARCVFRLPVNHESFAQQLRELGPGVDATSSDMDNARYLQEMAAVDVVLVVYDPAFYSDQMSGIVLRLCALVSQSW